LDKCTPLLTLISLYKNEIIKVPFKKIIVRIKQDNAFKVLNSESAPRKHSLKLTIIKAVKAVVLDSVLHGFRQIISSFQELIR
jgi:hypothetical protein